MRDARFPVGFRRLKHYVYGYLNSESDVRPGRYPYPSGYDTEQPPSPAGGGAGGNPSLWDEHVEVRATLTNTGEVVGKEVVQLYVSFASGPEGPIEGSDEVVDFPEKVLRAFDKIELSPGDNAQIRLVLTRRDLSYWCVKRGNWVMPTHGNFTLRLGTSSRDLPLSGLW